METKKYGPLKRFKFEKRDGSKVIVSAFNTSEAFQLAGMGVRLLTITKAGYGNTNSAINPGATSVAGNR